MKTNENRFEMVGTVMSIRRNQYGNVYMSVDVKQGDTVLHPAVFISKNLPFSMQLGQKVFVTGFVKGTDRPNKEKTRGEHIQVYYATQVNVAKAPRKYMPEEYLKVYVTGKLVRILDSGHGWKKIVLETLVKEEGEDKVSNVSIGYYASDNALIHVRDLKMGAVYEILIKPVTPVRERKNDGAKITYNNLVAEFSREIAA